MFSTHFEDLSQLSFLDEPVVDLSVDLLKDIPLEKYPPQRVHFLVDALQKGNKLPSECSMRRSEKRNQKKMGASRANQVLNRVNPHLALLNNIRRISFYLPCKFGLQPVKPRTFGKKAKVRYYPRQRDGRVVPKKSISIPAEVVKKNLARKAVKIRKGGFRVFSPRLAELKAKRTQFIRQVQNYRLMTQEARSKGLLQEKKSNIPLYFQKKKASQQRRRRQKHLLIKCNRKALVQIFGDAVYKRGWPVSRKQIKLALGIKEQDHMNPEFLREFLEMSERKTRASASLASTQRSNNLPVQRNYMQTWQMAKNNIKLPFQVSRMIRKVGIKQENKTLTSVQIKQNFPTDKFKSCSIEIDDENFPSLFDLKPKAMTQLNRK